MAYWKANHDNDPALEKYTYWNLSLAKKIARRPGGMTPEFEQWLARVIDAQVKDFILPENVTANRVITGADDAYELTVSDSQKRAIQSVERNIYAELPAVEAYKELVDAEQREDIEDFGNLRVGKVYGDLSWPMPYPTDLTDLDYLKRVIGWYNEPESTWNVPSFEQKWYAVNDAEGNRHVASIYSIKDNSIIIPAFYGESEPDQHPIYLKFEKENPGDTFGKLIVVFFVDDDGAIRGTFAENLTRDLKVWTMVSGSRFMQDPVYIPITENAFVINKDNCGEISISYTDIAQISDIRDVDDDDSAFDSTVTITDNAQTRTLTRGSGFADSFFTVNGRCVIGKMGFNCLDSLSGHLESQSLGVIKMDRLRSFEHRTLVASCSNQQQDGNTYYILFLHNPAHFLPVLICISAGRGALEPAIGLILQLEGNLQAIDAVLDALIVTAARIPLVERDPISVVILQFQGAVDVVPVFVNDIEGNRQLRGPIRRADKAGPVNTGKDRKYDRSSFRDGNRVFILIEEERHGRRSISDRQPWKA